MCDTSGLGLAIIEEIQRVIDANASELTQLDSAIGDGDHGSNLRRGFNAVLEKVRDQEDQSLQAVVKTTAMTLISTVGGAAGPLYGTAFLRASTALAADDELTAEHAVAAFEAAVEGVKARGKATTGEKTMLDALVPALETLQQSVNGGESAVTAFAAAAGAADAGRDATVPLKATKGRASYLGDRSIGHQDPGATSSALIVNAIADVLARHCAESGGN